MCSLLKLILGQILIMKNLDEHLEGLVVVVVVVDVVEPYSKKKCTGSVDLKGNLYLPTMF